MSPLVMVLVSIPLTLVLGKVIGFILMDVLFDGEPWE